MNDKSIIVVALVLGNLALFGAFMYVVFWLGANPWWMAFPALIHFSIKDWRECECKKEEDLDDDEEFLG